MTCRRWTARRMQPRVRRWPGVDATPQQSSKTLRCGTDASTQRHRFQLRNCTVRFAGPVLLGRIRGSPNPPLRNHTRGGRLDRAKGGGRAASALTACAACHSPDGAGVPARYPRLSGQHADYTFAQLQAFKAGTRGMDKEGKDLNGRVMAQIAARMSERDMRAVAEYTSGLH